MLLATIMIIGAVVVLFFGAEFSLDASDKLGKRLGLSPLAIGMLIVGFGTSLPEFFVGHIAGMQGKAGIAFGSLIGSNIANMFLVLGICGLINTLTLKGKSIRHHLGVHLILAITLVYILNRNSLGYLEGGILLSICASYLILLYKDMRSEVNTYEKSIKLEKPLLVTIKLLSGFFMLYVGGELLVRGGSDLCRDLGIEEYIISSIFIAFGTSFPELVTSLIACIKKKESDLIIGNIIGSNLFNCTLILGSLGIYHFPITGNFAMELTVLVGGSAMLLVLNLLNKDFHRLSAILFVSVYFGAVAGWMKLF